MRRFYKTMTCTPKAHHIGLLSFFLSFILLTVSFNLYSQKASVYLHQLSREEGLSNNMIYTVLQDKQGFLWIGTLNGLNRYDGYEFKVFRNIPGDTTSLYNNRVKILHQDQNGYIWIAAKNAGVDLYDPKRGMFKHFHYLDRLDSSFTTNEVRNIYDNAEGEVCFETTEANFIFNPESHSFSKLTQEARLKNPEQEKTNQLIDKYLSNSTDISIVSNVHRHSVWVVDGNYLKRLSDDQRGIKSLNIAQFSIQPGTIRSLFEDQAGILWIGTRKKGLLKYNPATEPFNLYNAFSNKNVGLENFTVRAVTKDRKGYVWVGTANKGLMKFKPETENVHFYQQSTSSGTIGDNRIRTLFTDRDGTVWAGGYGGLFRYNEATDDFRNFRLDEGVKQDQDEINLRVYDITEDYYGQLWIANWDNLICFNKETLTYQSYDKELFKMDNIRDAYFDQNNLLWLGAEFGGLVKIKFQGKNLNQQFDVISYSSKISHQNIYNTIEDESGRLWVATFNGLNILNKETGKVQIITTQDGLPSNIIYSILKDKDQKLWLTTSDGLVEIDPKDLSIKTFNTKYGLQSNEFTEGAAYIDQQANEIIIGGTKGLNIFNPDNITSNPIPPKTIITNLTVLNEEINPEGKGHQNLLTNKVAYTDQLRFTRKDKAISFEFSGLHFSSPENNQYAYMLEGFDINWNYVDSNKRHATYTNLMPGKYAFKVKSANSDGLWNAAATTINIEVLPAIWETWYAFVGYFLLGIGVIILVIQTSIKQNHSKNAIKLERIEREKAEELNQHKLKFFTNISHEFRTALTLILGPLNEIHKISPKSPIKSVSSELNMINRSTVRLLDLTNQILDFRKMENDGLQLKARKTEIIDFAHSIYSYYKELAKRKRLKLKFEASCDKLDAWIDHDLFEKIIANMLSNATKFTEEEGRISISITDEPQKSKPKEYMVKVGELPEEADYFEISIKDSGIGIPPHLLANVFKRFYQVDNLSIGEKGTGIGLSMVKEMIEIHKGEVLVKSKEGNGSEFTIRLLKTKSYYSEDEIVTQKKEKKLLKGQISSTSTLSSNGYFMEDSSNHEKSATPADAPQLLIVDDNDDFRNYLKRLLSSEYNVLETNNAYEALDVAKTSFPDIIISDVTMPDINGNELCKQIKNNLETSHIPVILLTAKSTDESVMEGLESGANFYITKPFRGDELKARIKNLLQLKRKLKAFHLNKIIDPEEKPKKQKGKKEHKLGKHDDKFLKKVVKVIETNISNAEFNVESMSRELGLSRSSLHNKLKALTGQSATEFVRSIRLKNAVSCMKEGNMNIVEISYNVGFNTPSYFIKCFKKQFGTTPKEYFTRLQEEQNDT